MRALTLLSAFVAYFANASFQFSPIVAELGTTGPTSTYLAKLVGDPSLDTPILIRISERNMDESGQEIQKPSKDIEVFPSQFILPAKTEKYVRVVWKGVKELPFEKAYRIHVEQPPVDLVPQKAGKGSVKILINYTGSIYVSSKEELPDVKLTELKTGPVKNKLSVILENSGNAHLIVSRPEIEVSCGKVQQTSKVVLKGDALKNLESKNLLAKTKLQTTIDAPKEIKNCDDLKWSFKYALE